MSDTRPDKDLPAFGSEVESASLRQKLEAMREAVQRMMGLRGDPERAAVRWADVRSGRLGAEVIPAVVVTPGGNTGGGNDGGANEPDLTKPPEPTGLAVTSTSTTVLASWDAPIYSVGHGHKQTNVYAVKAAPGGGSAVFAQAVRVASAVGPLTVLALPSETSTRWSVWIRFESNDGVESDPAGGAHGVVATTGRIGSAQIDDLAVQARMLAPGAVDLRSDQVQAAAQFGAMAVGYAVVEYLFATSGLLENLVVNNAQIAELDAAKLTAGDGAIGGRLKSTNYDATLRTGWLIRPDGFVDFRAGSIGGVEIGGDFLRTQGYIDGANGFYTDAAGALKVFGQQGARVFNTAAAGSEPVLRVGEALSVLADGNATFSGQLQAASGTFAGEVAAGSVDVQKLAGKSFAFSAAGTYQVVVPTGFTVVKLTLRGGGGSSGATRGTAGGGGGGQGGLAVYTITNVAAGTVINVTVGDGGVRAANTFSGDPGQPTMATIGGATYEAAGGYPGTPSFQKAAPDGGLFWHYGRGGLGGAGAGAGAVGVDGSSGAGTQYIGYMDYAPGNGMGGGSGGSGGGADATGSGVSVKGRAGSALVEVYNPNGVVLRSEWSTLVGNLSTRTPTSNYTWP